MNTVSGSYSSRLYLLWRVELIAWCQRHLPMGSSIFCTCHTNLDSCMAPHYKMTLYYILALWEVSSIPNSLASQIHAGRLPNLNIYCSCAYFWSMDLRVIGPWHGRSTNNMFRWLTIRFKRSLLLTFILLTVHITSVFSLSIAFASSTMIILPLTFITWFIYYILCPYMTVLKQRLRGCPSGVMVKAMDCGIVVCEFILQSCYYVHFRVNTLGKGMNPLILPATGKIVPRLFFQENGFGIKLPKKVDMPSNKETKSDQPNCK